MAVHLRDLMSRTHTYVNDRQVSECRLKYGDVLRFGEMRFRFVDLDVLRQSLAGARTSPAELLHDGAATPLAVCSPIFVIGRQRGADLRLSGKLVSKVHAILYEHAGKHTLRDLSSQGTLVDGQRIRSVELKGGETIEIDGLQVRYRFAPTAESAKPAEPRLPEAETATGQSPPLAARLPAHEEAEENDAMGEQHVFAPEPEILSPSESLESRSAAGARQPLDAGDEPPGKTRELQPLDAILGQEILTLAPGDVELAERAAASAPRPARRLPRLILAAIAAVLLLAVGAAAWVYFRRHA